MAVISKWVGQRRRQVLPRVSNKIKRRLLFRWLLIGLALVAFLPPLYFHFKLRHFRQMQLQKCHWIRNPPLVCAHGGDSSKAFPNTMDAYRSALISQVDCIEIDVSRSLDGALFALHDRELQQISGNRTSRVGHLSMKEIEELHSSERTPLFHDVHVPTIEDALKMVMGSVRQVILDAKVGPPLYEKGFAKDIVDIVQKTGCKNCVIWAKSDILVRDVMKLSPDVMVGYIVMIDFATGSRTKLLRMRGADVEKEEGLCMDGG